MHRNKHTETGQVLVLLTVGIITLLGFAALAIDGGRLYSEKRTVQGVTDTSSLTGALYIAQHIHTGVDSSVWAAAEAAAYQRAANNGYDGTQTDVEITEDASYYYVEATIHSTIPPTIVQLVYDGPLSVAAASKARVPKSDIFALGQALVSLEEGDCPHPGMNFSGTAGFAVHNTGIFSNSYCDGSIDFDGDAEGEIEGNIAAVGSVEGADHITSQGIISADPISLAAVPEPNCAGLSDYTASGTASGDRTLLPGIYRNGISVNGNADVVLTQGLYCLGDNLTVNNGSITGNGVTIFMQSGAVSVNGGNNVLTAPYGDIWQDATPRSWNGMLFFFSYSNYSPLTLNGNGDSTYVGTIFNYNDSCTLSGTGDAVAFNSQLVCNTIVLTGTAFLDITYNPEEQYHPSINIDLVE